MISITAPPSLAAGTSNACARSTRSGASCRSCARFQLTPHVIRTGVALIAKSPTQDPCISPDIGCGFGNKVRAYPRLHLCCGGLDCLPRQTCHGSRIRIENLNRDLVRARLSHDHRDRPPPRKARVTGSPRPRAVRPRFECRRRSVEWAAASSTSSPCRYFPRAFLRSTRTASTPTRRRRLRLSRALPGHGGGPTARARYGILAQMLKMDPPAKLRLRLSSGRAFRITRAGWYTIPAITTHRHEEMIGAVRICPCLRRQAAAQREAFRRGETLEIRGVGVRSSLEIVAPAVEELRHPWECDVRFLRNPHAPHRCGASSRVGSKSQGSTRPPGRRSSTPKIAAFRPTNIIARKATPTPRPYGPRHLRLPFDAGGWAGSPWLREDQGQGQRSRPTSSTCTRATSNDIDGFRVERSADKSYLEEGPCAAAYNSVPPGHEPGLERR